MSYDRRLRALETQVNNLRTQVARLYQITGVEMTDITSLAAEEQQIEADQALEDQAIQANTADIQTALAAIQSQKAGQTVTPEQLDAAEAALLRVDAKIKAQTGQLGTDDATLTGNQNAAPSGASGQAAA